MAQEISIRPLHENEFSVFVDFQSEALFNTPEIYGSDYESYKAMSILDKEQAFEKLLDYPFNYVMGAFDVSGSMIGMAGFSVRHKIPKQSHKGYIWSVYVSDQFRSKGIATRLVEDVMEAAKVDAGVEQFLVSIAATNLGGQQLYRKLGFIQYGAEVRALKLGENDYVDEILMVRLF